MLLASDQPVLDDDAEPWLGVRQPTEREFRKFAALVHDAAGIALSPAKRSLVMRRLSPRIKGLGFTKLAEYVGVLGNDRTGAELQRLLDLIVTNETHFFREPRHFDFLGTQVFPGWAQAAHAGDRPRAVRAWSAACSTGQEPYSMAMQLLAHFPAAEGWHVDVLGSDISTKALGAARSAEWPIRLAKEIPGEYLKRFMLKGTGEREGRMRASRELRAAVRFARVNLNDERDVTGAGAVPPAAGQGTFDVIFCRNVLIYFSPKARAAVIDRLIGRLAPDGLLVVGHAESLHTHRDRLRPVATTVYARCA